VFGAVGSLAPYAANQSELRFFVPAVLAWGATFLYLTGRGPLTTLTRARTATVATLAVLSAVTLWPDDAPRTMPPVTVNVRWAEGMSDAKRVELEGRLSLVELQRTDNPDTRVYDLRDVSRDNVRAIVQSAAVRDTFHINRTTFEVDNAASRPWYGYPSRPLMIATAVGLWLCGFALPSAIGSGSSAVARAMEMLSAAPMARSMGAFALLAVPVFILTSSRTLSPAIGGAVKPFNGTVATPAALIPRIDCTERYDVQPPLADTYDGSSPTIPEVISCPPDQAVADWVRAHVPVNAVFAIDRWNAFMPTVFLPQQAVSFSGFDFSLPNEVEIYPAYVRWYRGVMQRRGVQPFFNDGETAEQRQAFVRELGVTHVLIDPPYYSTLRPVLDRLPQVFARRYDDGRWAVYEVLSIR
jgi:hypothetical protein